MGLFYNVMRVVSSLIGLLMMAMGCIWILQGLNIAFLNSFMADQRQWALYGAILAHPFLTGLADGTLPEESFAFYVIQDALYLRDYARALAAVASRAPTASATRMFAGHGRRHARPDPPEEGA